MLRRLASQTATYGLTSILGRLIGNLLLPLQTGRLSLPDFSVLSEALAYAAVLSILFPLGLETALFRFSNDNPESKSDTENRIISLQLICSLALLPVSWLFLLWRMPELGPSMAFVVTLTLAADSILGIFLAALRNHNQSFAFFRVRVGSILFTILLNLAFLSGIPFLDELNPVGVNFRLILVINLVSSVLSFFLMPRSLTRFVWRFDPALTRTVLRFSIPIVVMGLAGVSNDILGRIWLENLCPPGFYPGTDNRNLIGIFSGCAKIAIFINLGIQAYRYAADPFFFSIQDKKDTASYLSSSFTWFVAAGLLALVGIQGNLPLILRVFLRNPGFMLGMDSILFLLLANFMFGVYYNLSFWYKFADKTWWGTIISLGGLVINALLNLVLVPRMGMNGAAIALLAGYTAMCGFSWYKSRGFFRVDWEYGKVGILMISALLLAWASGLYRPDGFWPPVVWGLFFPVAFAVIVLLVQGQPLKNRFRRAGTR